MRRRWRTRRVRWWFGVTVLVVALWAASLLITITHFGGTVTVTVEQGLIGVYWGGDALGRNMAVDNHFSAPWSPGRGAGRSFPEGMTWAVYGPRRIARPGEWPDLIRCGAFFTCVLGLWRPSIEFENGRGSLILPTWALVLVASTIAFLLWWRDRRFPARHCQTCGYDLTGNVSGRCPECGAPTGPGKPRSGA
jgi:hypothetical protein